MNLFPKAALLCLAASLPYLTAQPVKTKAANATPEVLFVCEHGAAKSIIAAAEFNRMAKARGLPYRAVSRGTHPDAQFSEATLKGLKKDRLPEPKGKPQMVTSADVTRASRVVTLGCNLPDSVGGSAKTEDWNDISSPGKDYDSARKDIDRRLEKLLGQLSQTAAKK